MVSTALVLMIVTGLVYLWRNGTLSLIWQVVNGSRKIVTS